LLYNNRGFAKYKLGDYKGALEDIDLSISLLPNNSYAFRNRALVHLAQNEKELACADMQKALDLGFAQSYGDEISKLQADNCR